MNKLLLVLALLITQSLACTPNTNVQGLQSGFLSIAPNNLNQSNTLISSTHTHNFNSPLVQIPSVGFGIWDASFVSQNSQQFNQFGLHLQNTTTTSLTFQFLYAQSVWSLLRIGFWASTTSHIIIGTSSFVLNSLTSSLTTSTISTPNIQYPTKSIGRTFLNGWSLNPSSTLLQIQIECRNITNNAITVAIATGPYTDLKSILFTYFIIAPEMAPFASYGGSVARTALQGIHNQDISGQVSTNQFFLLGLTRINSPFNLKLTTSLDKDFVISLSQTATSSPDLTILFIGIGVIPQQLCQSCPNKYFLYNQCLSTCPNNSRIVNFDNGAYGCRVCSALLNQVYNSAANACACAQGYINNNGTCAPITSSSANTAAGLGGVITIGGGQSQGNTQPIVTSVPTVVPVVNPNNNYLPTNPNVLPTPIPNPNNNNSYIPTTPNNSYIPTPPVSPPVPTPPHVLTPPAEQAQTAASCSNYLNTYWTGYRCSCRVGYKQDEQSGQCVKITITQPTIPTCGPYQIYLYNQCVCQTGYTLIHNTCTPIQACPPNSYSTPPTCTCNQGYTMIQNKCQPINTCSGGKLLISGRCTCPQGYTQSNGQCVVCGNGAILIGGRCTYICGINQVYNDRTNACQCRNGYGYYEGNCKICTGDYFLYNGYCVTCPLFSIYNPTTRVCTCKVGYQMVSGTCRYRCTPGQTFNPITNTCICPSGLAILSDNTCGICPTNFIPDPSTNRCTQCSSTQIYQNGQCKCRAGLGLTSTFTCINCATIGSYLQDGYCLSCPFGKILQNNVCICRQGTTLQPDGSCLNTCNPCSRCSQFEQLFNGVCRCRTGYTRNPATNLCQLQCPSGYSLIRGVCGVCPAGTIYNQILGECQNPGTPCQAGFYRSTSGTCVACSSTCATCSTSTTCLTCRDPLANIVNGQCIVTAPRCGNAIIQVGQQCDDRNIISGDGCSSTCQIQTGYICTGTPSVCSLATQICGNGLPNPGETCDDGNTNNGDGCSSLCKVEAGFTCTSASSSRASICAILPPSTGMSVISVTSNSMTVMVFLYLDQAFTFTNQAQMTSFIQYTFPSGSQPASGFCRQRPSSLRNFDCLFNYPGNTLPVNLFNIEFRYSRNGVTGFAIAPVNTQMSTFATRSLY